MDNLQKTLNNCVNIGSVFGSNTSMEDQVSHLWTELWWLSTEVSQAIGPSWKSLTYYEGVLRETHARSLNAGYWLNDDGVSQDRDLLIEALDEFCPPGVYFGPHPDYAWDWGFWPTCWKEEE